MRHVPTRLLHVAAVGVLALGFLEGTAAQSPQPAAWLIFVDDLHLDFRNTGRLRDLIRRVVSFVQPTELIGIRTSGPSNVIIDPTSDVTSVRYACKRIVGNGLRPSDFIGNADSEASHRADVSLHAALEAISTLESTDASQKVLIYVSNGYVNFDRVRTSTTRPDLAYGALRAQVVIHVIDPRELTASSDLDARVDEATWQEHLEETRASLRAIADSTGLVLHANLDEGLKQIARAVCR
jgi:hypothetical protein